MTFCRLHRAIRACEGRKIADGTTKLHERLLWMDKNKSVFLGNKS
ncbi:hypothetical protein HMPREF3226_02680 [Prevotella corporis]|uniref:Uncharacterized protein n=1 Tax=Prevotella corporis TaxID=28128 RepID=A0A133PTN9_9BACT|nr:hypothetical protein HMPREF3226_02680 [Prevotella corporis]